VLQGNEQTTWVAEHLIKEKKDVDLIARHVTAPAATSPRSTRLRRSGQGALIRGHICCFDVFGQPGTCRMLLPRRHQRLIMETWDDPRGSASCSRPSQAQAHLHPLDEGARFDVNELGGGDASTTVISPAIFNELVAPLMPD